MVNEIDIAFALLRCSFENPEVSKSRSLDVSLSSKDWWSLFRLMQQNHVAALTADAMTNLDVPREVKIPWLAEFEKACRWHRYQQEVQQDIIDTMQKHGIETLVLKGTHLSQYYPQPETREFGDLDLYFYDRHDEADRVAREVLKVEVSNDAHHHSKYNYRGVTVESHYDFLNTHYPPSNRRYEALLKSLVANSSPVSGEVAATRLTEGYTFELLFLLRHMAGHFAASRITLRDLVDWTLTCKALEDKADWTLIDKTIEDYGMTDFVTALNTIAERRLGISRSRCLEVPKSPSLEVSKSRSLEVPKSPSLEVSKSRSLEVSLVHMVEHDVVYGSVSDSNADGPSRLFWKLHRWRALSWKRRLVFNDPPAQLLLTSLTSHASKPQSILHKQ